MKIYIHIKKIKARNFLTVTNYCVNVNPLFHVQIAKTRKVKNTQLIARNFLLNAFTNPSQLDGRSRVSSRSPLHLFHISIFVEGPVSAIS